MVKFCYQVPWINNFQWASTGVCFEDNWGNVSKAMHIYAFYNNFSAPLDRCIALLYKRLCLQNGCINLHVCYRVGKVITPSKWGEFVLWAKMHQAHSECGVRL